MCLRCWSRHGYYELKCQARPLWGALVARKFCECSVPEAHLRWSNIRVAPPVAKSRIRPCSLLCFTRNSLSTTLKTACLASLRQAFYHPPSFFKRQGLPSPHFIKNLSIFAQIMPADRLTVPGFHSSNVSRYIGLTNPYSKFR